MNNEKGKKSRGRIRWSEEGRKRLMEEYAVSGQTKKEFCLERGVNLGTFHGWYKRSKQKKRKKAKGCKPVFKEVHLPVSPVSPIEIILPGGVRVCLRESGNRAELVELIRGIAQC